MINISVLILLAIDAACILTSRILSHSHFQPDSHQMHCAHSAEATCTWAS